METTKVDPKTFEELMAAVDYHLNLMIHHGSEVERLKGKITDILINKSNGKEDQGS